MAVNHNVNPRPLTAEEKENRARGIYDSFATYVVFCGHCRHVRKTNMYIMENRSGRSATRWARPPASSSSDIRTKRLPHNGGSLFYGTVRGKTPHFGTRNKNMVPKTHRVCYSDDNLSATT